MQLQTPTVPLGPDHVAWSNPSGSQVIVQRDGLQVYWRPADELMAQGWAKDIYLKLEDIRILNTQPLVASFKQAFLSLTGAIVILPQDAGAWLLTGELVAMPNQQGSFIVMAKAFSYGDKVPVPLVIRVITFNGPDSTANGTSSH